VTRSRSADRRWLGLALLLSAAIAATDGVLLEVTRGAFGNGFGGVLLDTWALRGAYFGLATLLNATVALALWAAVLPVLRAAGQSGLRSLTLCALGALALAGWSDLFIYHLHVILGTVLTPGVIIELAGSPTDETSAIVSSVPWATAISWTVLAVAAIATLLAFLVGLGLADRLAARAPKLAARFPTPRASTLLVAALLGSATCLWALSRPSPFMLRIVPALASQPSAALFTAVANLVTDVDRDGSGLLSRPPDPDPFDAGVHRFAIDQPGNGVDENLLAGDLPPDTAAPRPMPLPSRLARTRPHVLIVYLESFRYDLLQARREGRLITPFLTSLANHEGGSSHRMFVHSPYTVRSRAQMFGGTLVPRPGQPTWIDDFNALGYRTGHFSAQDDSFGGSEELLGLDRADAFYDARSDTAQRTSRSTAAASLQVSWKLLLERVDQFLDPLGDDPIFLFVNIVDTHYPYHHDQLDMLLPGDPVGRDGIRSYNREQVWRTYENTAANVDRAAERLVAAFRRAIGDEDHVILVTADHGQAFYEEGVLGHGHALDRDQSQVPLIVWGRGGVWPEPIGAADLRGLLLASLDAPRADHPEFRADPDRRLFQYLPNIDRPEQIAFRTADDTIVYDFQLGLAHRGDGSPVATDDPGVVDLIRAWEQLRIESSEAN